MICDKSIIAGMTNTFSSFLFFSLVSFCFVTPSNQYMNARVIYPTKLFRRPNDAFVTKAG